MQQLPMFGSISANLSGRTPFLRSPRPFSTEILMTGLIGSPSCQLTISAIKPNPRSPGHGHKKIRQQPRNG